MKKISEIAGVHYHDDEKNDVSLRVITDHIRSSVFMIGDGVIPSNSGRGYVLRRLIRRACRHGRLLGVTDPFLYKVVDTVIDENVCEYDYLESKREIIRKVIEAEEKSFGKTIDAGLALLEEYIDKMDGNVFSGEDAFKLNDTYGFPLDLTKDILEERGITVDEDKFNALLANQKSTARAARKDAGADAWKNESVKIDCAKTEFTGYTDFESESKVLALVNAKGELCDMLGAGDEGTVVLDRTPFYAVSGGQVGDSGVIKQGDNVFLVADTAKNADGIYLHSGNPLVPPRFSYEEAASVIAAPFWNTIALKGGDEGKRLAYLRHMFSEFLITGPFSILVGFNGGMMALNDRLKLGSLVAAEKGSKVYFASEESAIRIIVPEPERIWSPKGGECVIVQLDEGVTA